MRLCVHFRKLNVVFESRRGQRLSTIGKSFLWPDLLTRKQLWNEAMCWLSKLKHYQIRKRFAYHWKEFSLTLLVLSLQKNFEIRLRVDYQKPNVVFESRRDQRLSSIKKSFLWPDLPTRNDFEMRPCIDYQKLNHVLGLIWKCLTTSGSLELSMSGLALPIRNNYERRLCIDYRKLNVVFGLDERPYNYEKLQGLSIWYTQ